VAVDQERVARITAEVLEELRRLGHPTIARGARPFATSTPAQIRPYGGPSGTSSTPTSPASAVPTSAPGATLRPEDVGVSPTGKPTVTVNVSNRHIHLTPKDFETLFGKGAEPTPRNMLMQPGQFASKETVSLIAGRGRAIENVRILGPLRKYTQIEISRTDGYHLGIRPPVRNSGNVKGSAAGTLIGPKGTLVLSEGIIIADRHIHTPPEIARRFGLADNQMIRVRIFHSEKPTILEQVRIRVLDEFLLEMHLDTDDANATGIVNGDRVEMLV
jgi:putative phosphotransacetylase